MSAAVARRFGAALEVPSALPHLDALAALNERSVCRRYRPDPVPEALVQLLCATALSATMHTDRYDTKAIECELDAYDARRGKDWSGDKVKQYSKVMRADFGAHVGRKQFRLR